MSDSSVALGILRYNIGVKRAESVLIVTDRGLFSLAGIFFSAAQKLTSKSRLITIDIPPVDGTEPHQDVARMMRNHDVCLLITSKSLTHTKAREGATKRGARIASMPGLTLGMFRTALRENPIRLEAINSKLNKILSNKKIITITTKKGTNIAFHIKGRRWILDNGDFTKKGSKGNLPAGEIFIAPLEGTTEGTLVVDGSIAGIGLLRKPLIMRFMKGKLVGISSTKEGKVFSSVLKDDRYRNVAELGIGTNRKARICGSILEDEKVLGTFHVALGNNIHFGGKVEVPFHADSTITKPTITTDGRMIMKDGRFVKSSLK